MGYKITLDAGLINAVPPIKEIDVLKAWEAEGKLEIHEADRAKEAPATVQQGWPGAAPSASGQRPWGGRGRPPQKKNSATATAFNQLSAILFPYKDSHKLDMSQINNVARLIRHQNLENNIFVTLNKQDYIEAGKRESLGAALKIIVMTPDEAVAMLKETEGWGNGKHGGSTKAAPKEKAKEKVAVVEEKKPAAKKARK